MHRSRSSLLHLTVSTLMLAVALRTWLVMGLVEPVMVSGSSMAPALRGTYLSIACPKCGNSFDIGTDFSTDRVECLYCGFKKSSTQDLPALVGDRLFIDRTAFQFRNPRRWEPIVFRSPEDGELTVKRGVGLPDETIKLYEGDVWINGKVAARTPDEMRAMRQLIHVETASGSRWNGDADSNWRFHNGAWRISESNGKWHWLRYQNPRGEPIQSDSVFNGGMTQRLFPVRDLALSVDVHAADNGRLSIRFDNGDDRFKWEGNFRGHVLLEVFAFDRHWQVLLDDKLVAGGEFAAVSTKAGTPSPFTIGVKDPEVELSDFRVYRDIYYATLNEELGINEPMLPIALKSDQVFVVGDNVPVSIDSRRLGPVPLRFLVGKPLGVR